MIDREKIKNELPFGCISEIAKTANVSVSTISQFLSGKIKNSPLVESVILDFAIKTKAARKGITDQYNSYING